MSPRFVVLEESRRGQEYNDCRMPGANGGSLMSNEMPKCRITVIKRTVNQDLVDEYLEDPQRHAGLCESLTEGQEFIVDQVWAPPEGLCVWAWADIKKDILAVAGGGTVPGMKQPGVIIAGCTDWFRPVFFKIEKID